MVSDAMPGSPDGDFAPRGLSTIGLDAKHIATLAQVLRVFVKQDWEWYSRLVMASGEHEPIDLRFVQFPVTFIAGTWDSVSSAEDVQAVSRHVRGSRYVELAATHYIPFQFPSAMSSELGLLADRTALGRRLASE